MVEHSTPASFSRSVLSGAMAGLNRFKGVYRGLGSVAVGSAPGAALFFTTYEQCKNRLAACLVRVPTEVVKQRQQTSTYGTSTTSADVLKLVVQKGGIRALYQGFSITISREVPFSLIQFPLYEQLKIYAKANRQSSSQQDLPAHLAALCGSIAGSTAAAITTPLDVIKTRIMLSEAILNTLVAIQRKEGFSAFWKGVVPRTLWIGLGGAVFLGVYEASKLHLPAFV
ncbi:mitochondrial carrier domain-containing protein [Melampsora americana]|nr:mitochondrial carrier domain-containing protein [Melampsora americana]